VRILPISGAKSELT